MEQGYTMNMPSEILTSLTLIDGEIERVRVGGRTMNIKELELDIGL